MCFKNDNGEGSSDPVPRPSRGGAYHGRSSGGRQHVGQNQRDRHEEQHDTYKVEINFPQRERAYSPSLVVVTECSASTSTSCSCRSDASASTPASSLSPKAFPCGTFQGEIQQPQPQPQPRHRIPPWPSRFSKRCNYWSSQRRYCALSPSKPNPLGSRRRRVLRPSWLLTNDPRC
jgi:hypothetical protein